MAAAEITTGSDYHGGVPGVGLDVHLYQITTGTNGEDGVTIAVPCNSIVNVQATAAEADMITSGNQIAAAVDGTTVTVYHTAGATGDAALIYVEVWAVG